MVPRYNTMSDIYVKVKVTAQGQRSQTWRYLRSLKASCYFYFITNYRKVENIGIILIQSFLIEIAESTTFNFVNNL